MMAAGVDWQGCTCRRTLRESSGTMKCSEKVVYLSAWQAEQARRGLLANPRDKQAAARLVVYHCRDCKQYHVGHLRKMQPSPKKPKAEPKPPTPGEIRRSQRRAAESAERKAFFADWHDTLKHVARMVDAEIARMEKLRQC
jgi:hypothetical protein